jgi:hypothetical protein
MGSITVDIVLLLPSGLRAAAVETSALLARHMAAYGHPSGFILGQGLRTDRRTEPCEPHLSLFMLRVDETEMDEVVRRAGSVARVAAPVDALGVEYRHNPVGAPELHLAKGASWTALQAAVIREIEPLRKGRLRDVDPAGADLAGLVGELREREPGGERLRQLLTYGYDEIGDLFSPHVTFAWPVDEQPTPFGDLPLPEAFRGRLDTLAVFGMGSHGTCLTPYARFALRGDQEPHHVSAGVTVAPGILFGRAGRA